MRAAEPRAARPRPRPPAAGRRALAEPARGLLDLSWPLSRLTPAPHPPLHRQLDFNPFRCQRCSKSYCVEHRNTCPCPEQAQRVELCAECGLAVIVQPGEEADQAHSR